MVVFIFANGFFVFSGFYIHAQQTSGTYNTSSPSIKSRKYAELRYVSPLLLFQRKTFVRTAKRCGIAMPCHLFHLQIMNFCITHRISNSLCERKRVFVVGFSHSPCPRIENNGMEIQCKAEWRKTGFDFLIHFSYIFFFAVVVDVTALVAFTQLFCAVAGRLWSQHQYTQMDSKVIWLKCFLNNLPEWMMWMG